MTILGLVFKLEFYKGKMTCSFTDGRWLFCILNKNGKINFFDIFMYLLRANQNWDYQDVQSQKKFNLLCFGDLNCCFLWVFKWNYFRDQFILSKNKTLILNYVELFFLFSKILSLFLFLLQRCRYLACWRGGLWNRQKFMTS